MSETLTLDLDFVGLPGAVDAVLRAMSELSKLTTGAPFSR